MLSEVSIQCWEKYPNSGRYYNLKQKINLCILIFSVSSETFLYQKFQPRFLAMLCIKSLPQSAIYIYWMPGSLLGIKIKYLNVLIMSLIVRLGNILTSVHTRVSVTFRVSHRRREMYTGHARLCVCLSLAAFPHYCTDPDITWGNGKGCPLVVHYWADLQSVHGFCQARNLNKEDAMDRGRSKKLIKTGWWSGWRVGECFFWYRLTRVVPDKGP